MARLRLSLPAQSDLAHILATSSERWGTAGRERYATVLAAALRQVAAEPEGSPTRSRDDILLGIRSFHLCHVRGGDPKLKVRQPAHILHYRAVAPDLIEIVRVRHERMEPSQRVSGEPEHGT